ncbi:hypothetical protein OPT61_g10073 [Boeremia exigua]|uniref:Uncharacterized protein n=1 Tax=Boeremia exigua TaxID=749465 RepID=A0ACC2HS08_9PLEO|nr:hypothetical protein OPT61_g10073 [Boeremia exigua]
MSAPNVIKPNKGITGQIGNSISSAANYVSKTAQRSSVKASRAITSTPLDCPSNEYPSTGQSTSRSIKAGLRAGL